MAEKKYCRNCGTQNQPNAAYCASCGGALLSQSSQHISSTELPYLEDEIVNKIRGLFLPSRKKSSSETAPPAAPSLLKQEPPYSTQPRGGLSPHDDNVLMEVRGINGRIQLLDDRVRIVRKGVISLALQGIKGDKEIRISQIGAIKFKKARLTSGYMIFTFLGGQEYKGSLFGEMHDENGVTFYPNHEREFEAMKAAIEQKMDEARRPIVQQAQSSPFDELAKLATLRDQGVVTEEEFQEQKRKLLGT